MKPLNYDWASHWQRNVFSLFLACCIWYATCESLQITRTFTSLPVTVVNISPNFTVPGISPGGLIPERATLVLRGKKTGLNQLMHDRMSIFIDAKDKDRHWVEKITPKHLRCGDSKIEIATIVNKVILGEVNVPLTTAVTDQVPVELRVEGDISRSSFKLIDFWPKGESQQVFGPERQIQELKIQGLRAEIDLTKVNFNQLMWQWESQSERFDEIPYNYIHPIKWASTALHTTSFVSSHSLAHIPRLFFLRDQCQTLNTPLPLYIQPAAGGLAACNLEALSSHLGGTITTSGDHHTLSAPLQIQGVSRSFLNLVEKSLILRVQMDSGAQIPSNMRWDWQLAKEGELERRYIDLMRQTQTATFNPGEYFWRRRFQSYLKNMQIQTGAQSSQVFQRVRRAKVHKPVVDALNMD